MGHHRRVRLLSILGKIGWAPCPGCWTTPCWDGEGRRSTLAVRLGYGFVTLEGDSLGLVYLSPAQVGRLRNALRSAGVDLCRIGGEGLPRRPVVTAEASRGHWRRLLRPAPAKPTVGDVLARLDAAEQTMPIPAVPCDGGGIVSGGALDAVPQRRPPAPAVATPVSI